MGTYITQNDKYNTVNDKYIKSIIKIKMLIYYSFGGQKNIKKSQKLFCGVPNVITLVHFDLWNKKNFYFAIVFVWFKDSLI